MSDSGGGDYLWRLKSCLDDTACLSGLGPLPCRVSPPTLWAVDHVFLQAHIQAIDPEDLLAIRLRVLRSAIPLPVAECLEKLRRVSRRGG